MAIELDAAQRLLERDRELDVASAAVDRAREEIGGAL
jgi:hypothetical protein